MLERIRFLTAGESHGKGLLGIIEGLPSNIKISETYVKQHLSRRQKGHGRGGRMKIEDDFAEFIGVNYQILFGKYAYGETLGIKIYGVSLIIGLNWLLLAVTTRAVITRFINNDWIIVLLASLLMVGIDYLIEPVAPTLDFWRFEENPVPFSNYRDWFFVAILMQYVLSFQQSKSNMFYWSLSFIIILLLFFSFFHLTIV